MATGTLDCPYELAECIGEGGMGQVFRAHHGALDRTEALKILPARLAADEKFVVRLRREARATTMLTHPNIVSVFGFGRLEDGRYYLAMEHLVGETLEALLARVGALPTPLALRLLYQLASAMAHAHEKTVVHRDIKPANLMVIDQDTESPNLKVLDFGLAKILNPEFTESIAASVAGTIYGTPGYLAPERVHGVVTDPSIDVYSFGCVAYHVMTGHPPFQGSVMHVLHAHQIDTPPLPSTQQEGVHKALEAVVMRCLAKEPSERPPNGAALRALLEPLSGFSADNARRKNTIRSVSGTAPTLPEGGFATAAKTLIDHAGAQPSGASPMLEAQVAAEHQRLMLFQLAEALVNEGCRDVDLILCISDIHDAQARLRGHEARLRELLAEGEAIDQRFRKKQSMLRFALGDLSFEQSEGKGARRRASTEAESKANQLTEELIRSEHLHDRAMQEISEQEVSQEAQRYSAWEEVQQGHARLLQLVDCNLDEVASTADLQAHIRRYRESTR